MLETLEQKNEVQALKDDFEEFTAPKGGLKEGEEISYPPTIKPQMWQWQWKG